MAVSRMSSTRSRPLPPEAEQDSSDRKRRRKIWSCLECRRRKLLCDRGLPRCGRCVVAGQATECVYLDDPQHAVIPDARRPSQATAGSRALASPSVSGDDASLSLVSHERRIQALEAAAAKQSPGVPLPPTTSRISFNSKAYAGGGNPFDSSTPGREKLLFRGQSFRTKYSGNTHVSSLMGHIPGLNEFMRETFTTFPTLDRVRQDVKSAETRIRLASLKATLTADDHLKGLIPPRSEADVLVQVYMDSFDCIYHIVHLPSFQETYDELWADLSVVDMRFVVLLLLITAIAQCLTSPETGTCTASIPSTRKEASTIIHACDDWLQTKTQKYEDMIDFQIDFLLVLAKQLNNKRYKRTWANTGSTIRTFMCAGLHRDPELLGEDTSALDKEMRRRIWAAAVEFELQAAFEQGMPAEPWSHQSDTLGPANSADDDFEHGLDIRPIHDFTQASYLAVASQSTLLRHRLNTLLNDIHETISFATAKAYTENIDSLLQAIPQWTAIESEAPQALLSITLHQYLLALHERLLLQACTTTERQFSQAILVDSALKMVSAHKTVVAKGFWTLGLLCGDHLRAALSICYVYVTFNPRTDRVLRRTVEEDSLTLMEDIINMIINKVARFSIDQRGLRIAIAARCLMESKNDPGRKEELMQEAVDRCGKAMSQVVADRQINTSIGAHVSNIDGLTNLDGGMMPPLPLFFDDLADWTFDDWNFELPDLSGFRKPP